MKKLQTDHESSQPATADFLKKRPISWVLLCCVLIGCGVAVSTPLLGEVLGRFSAKESNVIALVPPEEVHLKTGEGGEGSTFSAGAERTEPEGSVTLDDTVSVRRADGGTIYTGSGTDKYRGEMQVSDDEKSWNSETRVNLFKKDYDGTVKSGDGEKVIAPGTSNFYDFTLKNNGNIPLDYSISIKVETDFGEQEIYGEIPLEWRLLSGDGTALGDWQDYSGRTEVLKQAMLDVRHQERYTIEWRWPFERGGDMDETDTGLGDLAVDQVLEVKATIIVHAEQDAEQNTEPGTEQTGPSGQRTWVKTGDTSNIILYLVLMTVSGCGLVIFIQCARRRKKRE